MPQLLQDLALIFAAFSILGGLAALALFVETKFQRNQNALLLGGRKKVASVEGLRGILASSVAVHHGCCWYFLLLTGVWSTNGHVLLNNCASFGVMQFFFLSGYLFWGKMIRQKKIPLKSFYLSRFVRIAPAYYAIVLIAVALAGAHWGMPRLSELLNARFSVANWLLFCLWARDGIAQLNLKQVTCGITWTLGAEWIFYLLLPFLAYFSRKKIRLFPLFLIFLVFAPLHMLYGYFHGLAGLPVEAAERGIAWLADIAKYMAFGFGGGILVVTYLEPIKKLTQRLGRSGNWILLLCYLAYLGTDKFLPLRHLCMLVGFALVVGGLDLFGLLTWKPIRILGLISYPIYLCHGCVYFVAMLLRGGMHPVAPNVYLMQMPLCLAGIFFLSLFMHILVERPTMKLSERLARVGS